MPERRPASMSRSASPTYKHCAGCEPACVQASSMGSSCGLRLLVVSPLTVQAGGWASFELRDQQLGQKRRLNGDDAPVEAAALQFREQFLHAREKARVAHGVVGVEREKARAQAFKFPSVDIAEAEAQQRRGTVRDLRADDLHTAAPSGLPHQLAC